MDLYTLDNNFLPSEFIGEFTSAIWTERYSSAGDVELVVPAKPSMMDVLSPGTFLGLRGTKEVMVIETQSVEKNLLTVKGSSLVKFLNEREAWFPNPDYDGTDTSVSLSADYTDDTKKAGAFLADVLTRTVISPAAFGSYWSPIDLDWANDAISGLALGIVDANGDVKRLTFPLGPLYDGIQNFASNEHLGFKLYLESATFSTGVHLLRFATYRGKNRTSDQIVNHVIRLTPQMDSLYDVKELSSISSFKNVIYVSYKNQITEHHIGTSVPTGFNRRVLRVDAPNVYVDPSHVAAFRAQVAHNAFVQNAFIKAVDGQVSTDPGYVFQKDYYLGDVVELEGTTGLRSIAQVTEYIRSQDKSGVREYPTLSVVDPVLFDLIGDLEPDPDFEIPWFDDPDWNFDFPDFPIDDPTFDDPIFDDPEDPEHTVKKRRHRRKPGSTDPFDPNPDPAPDYSPHYAPTRLVVGFYPDQNNGEVLGAITEDGVLHTLWKYDSVDPNTDFSWTDLIPYGWTADQAKIIVRSDDSKSSTPEYPWREGWTYWLVNPDGTGRIRLTDTVSAKFDNIATAPGEYYSWDGGGAHFWCKSATEKGLYINRIQGSPQEWVYADGTYSTDDSLHSFHYEPPLEGSGLPPLKIREHPTIADPGPILGRGSPIDTYFTPGAGSDLVDILPRERFDKDMKLVDPYVIPAPDGSKILITRGKIRPGGGWVVNTGYFVGGGTFRLRIGKYGDYLGGVWTSDIPWDADALTVWQHVYTAGHFVWEFANGAGTAIIGDPRDYTDLGWPVGQDPWSGGPLGIHTPPYYGQVGLYFKIMGDEGLWMDVDNIGISGGYIDSLGNWIQPGYGVQPSGNMYYGGWGGDRPTKGVWIWLADPDGTNMTEIDFGTAQFDYGGNFWSPDSKKLHNVAYSLTGRPYSRWWVYDIASGEISFPMDYSSVEGPYGYGPLLSLPIFSPNCRKIAWVIQHSDNSQELLVGDWDGSEVTNVLQLYHQLPGQDEADQDLMFLWGNQISWSFDNTKIACVDYRNPAPVWIVDVHTGARTKAFAGTGWDNPDEQEWIYDPMNFHA